MRYRQITGVRAGQCLVTPILAAERVEIPAGKNVELLQLLEHLVSRHATIFLIDPDNEVLLTVRNIIWKVKNT